MQQPLLIVVEKGFVNQQFFISSASYHPYVWLTLAVIILAISFSRAPLLLKAVGVICVCYAACCIQYPEQLGKFLGSSERNVAYGILGISLAALLISFARFLKAGLIIGLWLLVSVIVAERAFPGVVRVDVQELRSVDSVALHQYVAALLPHAERGLDD